MTNYDKIRIRVVSPQFFCKGSFKLQTMFCVIVLGFFHGSFKILRECNNYWNISFDIFVPVKRYSKEVVISERSFVTTN